MQSSKCVMAIDDESGGKWWCYYNHDDAFAPKMPVDVQ